MTIHDATTKRTTGVDKKVAYSTLEELRKQFKERVAKAGGVVVVVCI